MTTQPESPKNLFVNPTVIAAIIGGIFGIVVALIGVKAFPIPIADSISYENITITPATYPFEETKVEIQKGDDVEIVIIGADSAILDCGLGTTTVMGMVNNENQRNTLLPTANICSVIGRIGIGSSPYFFVGAYTRFIANNSGILFLGINDVAPDKCSFPDCFLGNTGKVYVHVTIRKK